MKVWKLFYICLKAILTGHWRDKVSFDTEAQHYDTHLVLVDQAYIEDVVGENSLVLSENAPHRSFCPGESGERV